MLKVTLAGCQSASNFLFARGFLHLLPRVLPVMAALVCGLSWAQSGQPFAPNNGLKPAWNGPLRPLNFYYPDGAPSSAWLAQAPRQPLTVATAPAYVRALKKFVEPSMRDMIEKPNDWNPAKVGWYDMPWQALGEPGKEASGGREAILGAFSGQVLPSGAFKNVNFLLQNHTVVYYDALSATMLKKLWADPYTPNTAAVSFPEGAMVVKAAGVTATPQQWPVVEGASVWNVWRPTPADSDQPGAKPVLVPLRVMQFDIIVKDSVASPQTGWVFTTFVYNKDAPGTGTWDKLVPLGAMWGNDPEVARHVTSRSVRKAPDPNVPLKETWINRTPETAAYALEQLGWGDRLSGPIDVARRLNVTFVGGSKVPVDQRASSCLSCHGTAQYPFLINLYPSPDRKFPRDGQPFQLYPPGSPDWNRWFQNRPGNQPQPSGQPEVALDYDMLVTFAISEAEAAREKKPSPQRFRIKAH